MLTSEWVLRATAEELYREQQKVNERIAYLKGEIHVLLAELLRLKGPCSNSNCKLHYAHSGPCEPNPFPIT